MPISDGGLQRPLFNCVQMMLKSQGNSAFMWSVQSKMDAAVETNGEEAAAHQKLRAASAHAGGVYAASQLGGIAKASDFRSPLNAKAYRRRNNPG
ncbi:hypothetical protein [Ottowia caeni]|uniref:hypothetical protein n=1 Tax=Ottowia caeni TaxID=2870339 RepID=UPI003D714826